MEDAYGTAWRAIGRSKQPSVRAVDLETSLGDDVGKVVLALTAGALFRGAHMACICLNRGDEPLGKVPDPVPLSTQALELLNEHQKRQTAERLRCPMPWPNTPENTHVFASVVGTALHPSNVSRAWRQILKRASVEHQTSDGRARGMHELRRTFATRLRDLGVPLEDVQRLGRWSSSKMLLEVYSASDRERLRRAADTVAEAMTE